MVVYVKVGDKVSQRHVESRQLLNEEIRAAGYIWWLGGNSDRSGGYKLKVKDKSKK